MKDNALIKFLVKAFYALSFLSAVVAILVSAFGLWTALFRLGNRLAETSETNFQKLSAASSVERDGVSTPNVVGDVNYALVEAVETPTQKGENESISDGGVDVDVYYELDDYVIEVESIFSKTEIEVLSKVVYGEARGCDKTQQAAVVWCILNRMDSDKFPNDIVSVVTQKNQFEGYSSKFPVTDEIKELVLDVLGRYEQEKAGTENVGRVLPNDYLFFRSSGKGTNLFRQNYGSKTIWGWSWGTPYDK